MTRESNLGALYTSKSRTNECKSACIMGSLNFTSNFPLPQLTYRIRFIYRVFSSPYFNYPIVKQV